MAKIADILARNLKALRGDLSQSALAEKAGIGTSIIQSAEAKTKWPGIDSIGKIAAALGIEESDLFNPGEPPVILEVDHPLEECVKRVSDAALRKHGSEKEVTDQYLDAAAEGGDDRAQGAGREEAKKTPRAK